MRASESLERDLKAIFSYETASFDLLAIAGGLNREEDFIGANLRGVHLANARLRGFNFTNADLRDTFIRLAKVDKTTILDKAKLDIEDELVLQQRGLLTVGQRSLNTAVHEASLRSEIDRLKEKCIELTEKIDATQDNTTLLYQLGMAVASIGTLEARLCRFDVATRNFTESRRIVSGIADSFESQQLLEGLLQRLFLEINKYANK